jgi:hypothetical protein
MGLAKKLGIVVLLYVILGLVWSVIKLSGVLRISANAAISAIIYAVDFFFMPVQLFLAPFILGFILPPPPVIF